MDVIINLLTSATTVSIIVLNRKRRDDDVPPFYLRLSPLLFQVLKVFSDKTGISAQFFFNSKQLIVFCYPV